MYGKFWGRRRDNIQHDYATIQKKKNALHYVKSFALQYEPSLGYISGK